MIEFTASHFDELCSSDPVCERIGTIETERKAAVRKFWLRLALGTAATVAAFWSLSASGWETTAWIVAGLFGFATFIAAAAPLQGAIESLKHPVLEELARRAGMEYLPTDFVPPVFAGARGVLFGAGLSNQSFTDLFNGADEEGLGYALYEADLQRRVGRNSYTVFSGQMYALQRRPRGQGVTAIVPDRGLFNLWKPARDMERVRIEADTAFEKKFEVYSTEPGEARQLLDDRGLRARLLELRKSGRVFVYVAPEEVLVAASGKNRFEPGSMFRSRAGEERARLMFDDICASFEVLRDLKARLG